MPSANCLYIFHLQKVKSVAINCSSSHFHVSNELKPDQIEGLKTGRQFLKLRKEQDNFNWTDVTQQHQ